ncbi:MAG TPA: GNAT family N-acetyltransferase [Allosphingosinicella sp.]|nr:GNAT family N-acetyltransferase [Allosphingosinicella sp.]
MPHHDALIRPPVDPGEFRDLIAIYEEAIPASERKSRAQVELMRRDPGYCFLGAFLDGRLIGFAIVYRFRGERLSLLEYMAVDSQHRNEGIGGRLFHAALAVAAAATPMLLEVESERAPSKDHTQRVKRKRFYRRLGCREIAGLGYVQPMGDGPPPMNLLLHDPGRQSLDHATVLQWLISLYVEVYGRPASDPRIAHMAGGLPEEIALI